MSKSKKLDNFNPLSNFNIKNNIISFGDLDLNEVFDQGHTSPIYIYSRNTINIKLQILRNLFCSSFKIFYSIKSNPFKDIVSFLSQRVDGFDVSSLKELQLALDTKIPTNSICYTGPGKSYNELETAVKSNVIISVESILEIEKIIKIGKHIDKPATIIIRVNPRYKQKKAGMKMASGSSPFGIDEELVPETIKWVENSYVNLKGFHIYTGSQILDATAINDAQIKIFELIQYLSTNCKSPIEIINVGGGFGIPYFSYHRPLDIISVANKLNQLLPSPDNKIFSQNLTPILELGRYIVGESGVYICQVIDKKVSRGKTYLITDGGMHHHLAASGNLGQKTRKNFPTYIANKIKSNQTEVVSIVGKLCTPLDILAEDVELSTSEVGDYVAIMNSGAYGLSASPTKFLGHPDAQEILI